MSKTLTNEAMEKLKNDEALIFKIAQSLRKKFRTVENWVRDEDDMLTSDAVKNIIKEHTGLTDEQILTEETADIK